MHLPFLRPARMKSPLDNINGGQNPCRGAGKYVELKKQTQDSQQLSDSVEPGRFPGSRKTAKRTPLSSKLSKSVEAPYFAEQTQFRS